VHWLSNLVSQGECPPARSSLQGGAVLVWLMGDTRLIRDDAKLCFRKSTKQREGEDGEDWKNEKSDDSEVDLEEVDYAQVLQHIDNFLPERELAGRPLDLSVLRQFGLWTTKRWIGSWLCFWRSGKH
jgi:hypothetical protein